MADPTPQQTGAAIANELAVDASLAAQGPPQVSYTSMPDLPPFDGIQTLAPDGGATYLGYGQSVGYFEHMGYSMQPVAAPARSAAAEFLRFHTGSCVKVITAVATRLGEKPVIPHWRTGSDNDVLLYRTRVLSSPGKTPEGDRIYALTVQYVYGLQVPPGDDDALDFGRIPSDLEQAPVLNVADYVTNLTAAAPVTPPPGVNVQPIDY